MRITIVIMFLLGLRVFGQPYLPFLVAGGSPGTNTISADVVVYGATSVGIAAAVQAKRMGRNVALINFDQHYGGMSANGLSKMDIGGFGTNYIGGLAQEWMWRCSTNYSSGWVYDPEPHVAAKEFLNMLAVNNGNGGTCTLYSNQWLSAVAKTGPSITSITTSSNWVFTAPQFIDATYEGDLMAMAGCSNVIGRESSSQYAETGAGVQKQSYNLQINPFVNGLPLIGVSSNNTAALGSADGNLQAFNFRISITGNGQPANQTAFYAPTNYNITNYWGVYEMATNQGFTSFAQVIFAQSEESPVSAKVDWNNQTVLFSTDIYGGTNNSMELQWVTNSWPARMNLYAQFRDYELGLLWFLKTSTNLPSSMTSSIAAYAFSRDEFTDNGNFPSAAGLYIREARRMVGSYVMTSSNIVTTNLSLHSIGLGAYSPDCHGVTRYITATNSVAAEGATFNGPTPSAPYKIDYFSITPQTNDCSNLLVPWCLSASHVMFDGFRIESTGMIIGQSAGAAASLCISSNCTVQTLPYQALSNTLAQAGQQL